jgi:hypothetical protein
MKVSGSVVVLALALLVAGASASAAPAPPAGGGTLVHGPSQSAKKVKSGAVHSPNWAGYAVTGPAGSFTSVTGSWVEPTVSCTTSQASAAAFWVGLDGYSASDNAVEQTGTDSDCLKGTKKKPGGPSYYAWWEIDTPSSTSSTTINDKVSPGDEMTATVTDSGGTYTMTLVDSGPTNTWSSTHVATSPTATDSSAEWIAEDPSVCSDSKCTLLKLADFGSVNFGGTTANGSSILSFSSASIKQIFMTKGKTAKASPSATSGSNFSVQWQGV